MKYLLKGNPDTSIIVIDEKEESISLLITRNFEGYEEQKKEFMKKEMFDMCLRTGYIFPNETALAV